MTGPTAFAFSPQDALGGRARRKPSPVPSQPFESIAPHDRITCPATFEPEYSRYWHLRRWIAVEVTAAHQSSAVVGAVGIIDNVASSSSCVGIQRDLAGDPSEKPEARSCLRYQRLSPSKRPGALAIRFDAHTTEAGWRPRARMQLQRGLRWSPRNAASK